MKKNLSLISALGIAIASNLFIPLESLAIPFNSNTIYKITNPTNGQEEVYFSGTPNTSIQASMGLTDRYTTRVADGCGVVRLTASQIGVNTTIEFNNATVDIATLPQQLQPSCINGTLSEPRPDNYKTPEGNVIIVGLTPAQPYIANIPRNTTRRIRINTCGFGRLRSTSTFTIPPSFDVNGSTITLATLPDSGAAPRCSRGVGYVPAAWI